MGEKDGFLNQKLTEKGKACMPIWEMMETFLEKRDCGGTKDESQDCRGGVCLR